MADLAPQGRPTPPAEKVAAEQQLEGDLFAAAAIFDLSKNPTFPGGPIS